MLARQKHPLEYTAEEIRQLKQAAKEAGIRYRLALEKASTKKGIRVLPSIVNRTDITDISPAMLDRAATRANDKASEEKSVIERAKERERERILKLVERLRTRQHATCWQTDGDMLAVLDTTDGENWTIQVYTKMPGRFMPRACLHKGLQQAAEYIISKGYDKISKQV